MTEGWGGWFGDDDDQPDEPAPVRTAQQERDDVVAWLRKAAGVTRETMRHLRSKELLTAHQAVAWEAVADTQEATAEDIATGQHEGASDA